MIRKCTLIFLCVCSSGFAKSNSNQSAEPAALTRFTSDSEPILTAFGCVNVSSGDFFLNLTELFIDGPEPLPYTICYDSGHLYDGKVKVDSRDESFRQNMGYGFGMDFPLRVVKLSLEKKKWRTDAEQRQGVSLTYRGEKVPEGLKFKLDPQCYATRVTNYSSEGISGRTDVKNTTLLLHSTLQDYKGGAYNVTCGDGSQRFYECAEDSKLEFFDLCRENKASGNTVLFTRYKKDNKLFGVVTYNPSRTLEFNSLRFEWDKKETGYTVYGSNGKSVRFTLSCERTDHLLNIDKCADRPVYYLSYIQPSDGPWTKLTMTKRPKPFLNEKTRKICRVEHPDSRFLTVDYTTADETAQVKSMAAPLGTDATPVSVGSFVYRPNATDVYDALNHKRTFVFSAERRLHAINCYNGPGNGYQLYKQQNFCWGGTNLMSKATCAADGRAAQSTAYVYDERGNIIKEEFFGNLTGKGTAFFKIGSGLRPAELVETYAKMFTYSNTFNLVLSETELDGPETRYAYKPGTNKILSQLVVAGNQITQRTFNSYDVNGLLIQTVNDDGSGASESDLTGVTTRKITRITPRLTTPAVGFPHSIVELYLDITTGCERQLKRTDYIYDNRELLIQEDVYDADNRLCYSLQSVYDANRNLVAKSDALGRITKWTYDANKNKLSEEFVGSGFRTQFAYDFSNRCIKSEEIHDDGSIFVTCYRYDYLGNKIAMVDPYKQETRYVYDDFNREIEVIFPPYLSPNGSLVSASTKKEYNILDQVTAVTDQNGQVTRTIYNVRGQPTCVTHPDGSQERWEYNLNGTLAIKWECNGSYICYAYDVLKRPLRTDTFDASGNLQCSVRQEYVGAQLVRTTDCLGYVTEFSYDGAGRKISEIRETPSGFSKSTYGYDSLGRLSVTKRWYDCSEADCVVQIQEYDPLDRVIETRIEDGKGNLHRKETCAYDIAGNKILNCVYDSARHYTVSEVRYNSRKMPILMIDALGNMTHITYDHKHINAFGQTVLCATTTDPLGQHTIITHDVFGLPVEHKMLSRLGEQLAHYTQIYDGVGNLVRRIDHVLANGRAVRDIVTELSYDPRNRPSQLREAVGTVDVRLTTRSYNQAGQLEAIHLPDGLDILHTYDAMGRLASYRASDNSVAYEYQYDAAGNLLRVADLIHGTTTFRHYDGLHRVSCETLENGLSLSYEYDALNRPTQVQLPDASAVVFRYDATHLIEVKRLGSDGKVRYNHCYTEYDLTGRAKTMTLPGLGGTLSQEFDSLRRPVSISSSLHKDSVPANGYDAVGNLVARELTDALGTLPCQYQYDDLYQLVSEKGGSKHTYQHDSLNNRVNKDGQVYEVNSLNALLLTGDTKYIYDKRGNVIQSECKGQITKYAYDGLSRLTEIETPTVRYVYQYDSFNRRTRETQFTKGWTGQWVERKLRGLFINQNDIGQVDGNGKITQLRILGEGRGAEIGASIAIELDQVVYIPLHDLCGNIIALMDIRGRSIAESYRYTAFGEEQIFSSWGYSQTESTISNPWRFSSKRTDPTGLVYFGRRYYNPITGRWLTPDPIGHTAGPNLYAYVHNNPLIHLDLYGLRAKREQTKQMPFFQFVGRIAESVCNQLLPPVVRPRAKAGVRWLSGRPAEGCKQCGDYPAHRFYLPGIQVANVRMSTCSGQMSTLLDSELFAQFIQEIHGDYQVYGIHNPTRGLIWDTIKSRLMRYGVTTDEVRIQAEQWIALYRDMDGQINRKIFHYAHSQAADIAWTAMKLVPPEVRDCIDITTIGGSKLIPDGWFHRTVNIVSSNDPIPKAADTRPYENIRRGLMPNVEVVQGSGWFDHPWSNDTYSQVLRKRGERFQSLYLRGE